MMPVFSDDKPGYKGTKRLAQKYSLRGSQDAKPDPWLQPSVLLQLPPRGDAFSLQTER